MERVVVVENLFSGIQNEELISGIDSPKSRDSKVGNRVDPPRKTRENYFFQSLDSEGVGSVFFGSIDGLIHSLFGVTIEYLERWKIRCHSGAT